MHEEFELNDQTYRIGKLNAFTQFHISRRLAPVIPAIAPLFSAIAGGELELAQDGQVDELVRAAMPLANALASMTDENANYVLNSCMQVISRKNQHGWHPIFRNETLMFDDIDLSVMLPLTIRVLRENLGGFIQGLATEVMTASSQPEA